MSQSQRGGKRKTDDPMDTGSPKRSFLNQTTSDVVRIDVISLNGKSFDHKFTSKDIKQLWVDALRRDASEIVGQSSSWLNKNTLCLNIELKFEVALTEVSPTPDFFFEKASEFQSYSYECKIVGFAGIKEAQIGDTVTVTLKRIHFRFKPEQAEDWLVVYGRIIGSARSVTFLCVYECVVFDYLNPLKPIAGIRCNKSRRLLHLIIKDLVRLFHIISCWLSEGAINPIADSWVVTVCTCVWGKSIDLVMSSDLFHNQFQQCDGQRWPENRSHPSEARTEGKPARMVADVRVQSQGVLPRDANSVQTLLGVRPCRQGLHRRRHQLEGLHKETVCHRELQAGDVRFLVGGTSQATTTDPRGRTQRAEKPSQQVHGPEKIGKLPQEGQGQPRSGQTKNKGKTQRPPKGSARKKESRMILWWNCRGGIRSKLDIIKYFAVEYYPELLFISESNIKDCDDMSVINIPGYLLVPASTIGGCSCWPAMSNRAQDLKLPS